ncbi:hypothetical protein [Streptomyces sp. WELS2]|uniref:hypothetical protein n=1 Tax=Streptomyces sp. WELS2 TaxID=2749435 RepID=UPI0015F0BA65|nr:hypothetical protein [Streptomyces sp. WELS2]
MWPDQQPPGGAQNPQHDPRQNPYQQPGHPQPNAYRQPGYPQHPQPGPYGEQPPGTPYGHQPPSAPYGEQPPGSPYGQQPHTGRQAQQPPQPPGPYPPQQPTGGPYAQPPTVPYGQPPQWGQPSAPEPPHGGGRTKLVALVAATAVVVTAAVTGFLVLGGSKDDEADGGKDARTTSPSPAPTSPASPAATDNPRSGGTEKPTVPGWKVVVNAKYGTAFDVPADWEVQRAGVFTFFEDKEKGDGSAYIGFSGASFLKPSYCVSDDDKDGREETSSLAAAGTKGEMGAKDTASVARGDSAAFAFGGFTDQSKAAKKYLHIGEAKSFTTASGVTGSVATSYVSGVPKKNKCDTDGKAVTFAFKNSSGSFVSWSLYGAKGVKEELSDATIDKILATVRLHGDPTVE